MNAKLHITVRVTRRFNATPEHVFDASDLRGAGYRMILAARWALILSGIGYQLTR